MADLSADREEFEQQVQSGAQQAPEQPESAEAPEPDPRDPSRHEPRLTPPQQRYHDESKVRMEAALARMDQLSTPQRQFGVPQDAEADAVLSVVVTVMLERGIISPAELVVRKARALTELFEQLLAQYEEVVAADTGLTGPDGQPIASGMTRAEREARERIAEREAAEALAQAADEVGAHQAAERLGQVDE